MWYLWCRIYHQISNISRNLVAHKIDEIWKKALRCSWSIAWRHCCNYIFDSTPGFNRLHQDNYKTRGELCIFWWFVASYIRYLTVLSLTRHHHYNQMVPKFEYSGGIMQRDIMWKGFPCHDFTICFSSKAPCLIHDDVIKWKHFPRYWPLVRRIHRSPVNSPHKGQSRAVLMFSLSAPEYKAE